MYSILIFYQNIGIQIQIHAIVIQNSCHLFRMQSCDISHGIFNMSSDVTYTVRNARFCRIRSPDRHLRCRLITTADLINQPVLQIFCIYIYNITNFTCCYQFPGQFYHCIASVSISHCKHQMLFFCNSFQFFSLFHSKT